MNLTDSFVSLSVSCYSACKAALQWNSFSFPQVSGISSAWLLRIQTPFKPFVDNTALNVALIMSTSFYFIKRLASMQLLTTHFLFTIIFYLGSDAEILNLLNTSTLLFCWFASMARSRKCTSRFICSCMQSSRWWTHKLHCYKQICSDFCQA